MTSVRYAFCAVAMTSAMFAAGCGSSDEENATGTPAPTATLAATATRTPTSAPPSATATTAITATVTASQTSALATPSRTATAPTPVTTPAGAVRALVVVQHSVGAAPGDALGAPPLRPDAGADAVSFDRALSYADWSVPSADRRGTTGPDGSFTIAGLPPGEYAVQIAKTLDGNLAAMTLPITAGDGGSATVVAEVSWGTVLTVSTYSQDDVTIRDVRGPYGTRLITRDGRLYAIGDASRTFVDSDGDGHFDVGDCPSSVWECGVMRDCGPDRACSCTSSCPFCDDCGPGVCVAKTAISPYPCAADGTCQQAGDRCVCVASCPGCEDCGRKLCVPGCDPVSIADIRITAGPIQLVLGRQGQMSAVAELSDGTAIDVTQLAQWESSDASVASVDSWGTVSALAIGSVKITATVGTQQSAPWSLEVVQRPTLQRIYVQNQSCYCGPIYAAQPDLAQPGVGVSARPCVLAPVARTDILPVPGCGQVIQVGNTLQFAALGEYGDGSYEDITAHVQWAVDPPSIGDVVGGLFTARAPGAANLTASLGSVSSDPTAIRVVTEPTVVSISIYADNSVIALVGGMAVPGGVAVPCVAPNADGCCCPGPLMPGVDTCGCGYTITVLRGDQLQFHATAQYDTGEWREVTDQATWRSIDASIAAIDTAGVMRALEPGISTIDAVLGSVTSNPVGVHVVAQATLQSLSIYQEGGDRVFGKGDQLFFHATGYYDVGISRDVTLQALWQSSDDAIAGFDAPGVLTGRTAGNVEVFAELDGQQSQHVRIEVFAMSDLVYCDPAHVNRGVWADDYNRVILESDCASYTQPGTAALRYTVTETRPHGGIFDPCLDLYVYSGRDRVRTIREEGCGDPFLPASAPARDQEALKYQLKAFWDLKDDKGAPVVPGSYTIYGRFYLYYDPVVSIGVTVNGGPPPAS